MVRTSKTQNQREVTRSPVKPRKARFGRRLFEGLKTRARAKADKLKTLAIALGIGVMVSCTPATLNAQDTAKRSPETPAGSVAKAKAPVQYETFSDPKELQPLFDNAKGKNINLKRGETKTIGDYKVKIYHDGESGVVFQITPKGESSHMGVVLNDALDNINILVVDAPANAGFKGKMLVFADYDTVYFQYFSKKEGRHEFTGVPLHEGRMRKGPINTGFTFDGKTIVVVNAPKDLRPGDVVCQADYTPDVSSGRTYFIYAPDEAPGTTVAMR